MRDYIAVLEGYNGLGVANVNPSASGGANYSGGGAYFSRSPTLPSGDWGLAGAGHALAAAAAAANQNLPTGLFPESMDQWNEGFSPNGTNAVQAGDDYSSYLAAFSGNRLASLESANVNPSGSGGANYSGGGAYFSRSPTLPSGDWGLASYDMASVNVNPSASGGANYSGGSSFFPGSPTLPSGEWGLAAVRKAAAIKALHGLGASRQRIVMAVRAAMDRPMSGTPCDQAFRTAYDAALAAGYDGQWASSAANRVMKQCMELGWAIFSTRA